MTFRRELKALWDWVSGNEAIPRHERPSQFEKPSRLEQGTNLEANLMRGSDDKLPYQLDLLQPVAEAATTALAKHRSNHLLRAEAGQAMNRAAFDRRERDRDAQASHDRASETPSAPVEQNDRSARAEEVSAQAAPGDQEHQRDPTGTLDHVQDDRLDPAGISDLVENEPESAGQLNHVEVEPESAGQLNHVEVEPESAGQLDQSRASEAELDAMDEAMRREGEGQDMDDLAADPQAEIHERSE